MKETTFIEKCTLRGWKGIYLWARKSVLYDMEGDNNRVKCLTRRRKSPASFPLPSARDLSCSP